MSNYSIDLGPEYRSRHRGMVFILFGGRLKLHLWPTGFMWVKSLKNPYHTTDSSGFPVIRAARGMSYRFWWNPSYGRTDDKIPIWDLGFRK